MCSFSDAETHTETESFSNVMPSSTPIKYFPSLSENIYFEMLTAMLLLCMSPWVCCAGWLHNCDNSWTWWRWAPEYVGMQQQEQQQKTNQLPECVSTVKEVSPEDAIKKEKYIVFTDTLMILMKSLHGKVCKRHGCVCVLKYHKTYVATGLVVSWRWNSGMLEADRSLNLLVSRLEQAILFLLLLCCCLGIPKPRSGWCSTSVICSISHQHCWISIRSYKSSLPSINTGKNTHRNVEKKRKQSWGRQYYYQLSDNVFELKTKHQVYCEMITV